jgi:O-antigen/teichoic acid export membrane protein
VTTEAAIDVPEKPINQPPSTAGMTTKVVKGSLWTLAGQVAPLLATLISTPITIRLLGNEGYGILILVGLIPMYISFADLGMGVASTRFGSVSYAAGDRLGESSAIWTAATIATFTSLIFAIPVFILSGHIMDALNVPSAMWAEGTTALRIAIVAFVFSLLGNIFNTPQLARLRMDLNSVVGGVSRVLAALAVPTVIYFGGGIVGATAAGLVVAVLTLGVHFAISRRLLIELAKPKFNPALIRPMLKFGLGLMISGVAAVFLANFEKLSLPRLVSVESLAFYSVAFTLANMATMYSVAMIQSLVPAFSQLQHPGKRNELQALYSRSVRLNILILLPVLMLMFVAAEPFFTIWAGEAFGRESTLPFHILLLGLLFNLVAYVPHGALTAAGRTDIFAKLYWLEAIFYVIAVVLLVNKFQMIGAAMAWSLRVILDAFLIVWLTKRTVGLSFKFGGYVKGILGGMAILSLPIYFTAYYGNFSLWLLIVVPASGAIYVLLAWKTILTSEEKLWFRQRLTAPWLPSGTV